jgi:hypothetical protein
MTFYVQCLDSVADAGTLHTVYACGSGEKGQLGNGRTGEHIATGNRTGFDIENEPSEESSPDVGKNFLEAHDVCSPC